MKWWKIYFWIFLAVLLIGLAGSLFSQSLNISFSLGDWISNLSGFILLIGLYIYVFKKEKFYKYKYIFAINLILNLLFAIDYIIFSENLSGLIHSSLRSNLEVSQTELIISALLSLPAIFANVKLSLNKTS